MKNPQLKVPTFHVTGTNGKGSVVRKLGACLLEAGKYIYTNCIYRISRWGIYISRNVDRAREYKIKW